MNKNMKIIYCYIRKVIEYGFEGTANYLGVKDAPKV